MPKQRQTCTRCSMRRQKCDRKSPCSRCMQNKEAHLCTTEWPNGYDPAVHRKYPRRSSPTTSQHPSGGPASLNGDQTGTQFWPALSGPGNPLHLRTPGLTVPAESQPLPNTSMNLDFVMYGRSDLADASMSTMLRDKEDYAQDQALDKTRASDLGEATTNSFSPAAQSVEILHLQSLLPSKDRIIEMTDYHDRCMSYWCGGIYHGPSFRKEILEAYGDTHDFDLRGHDWQWSALLFSVLSASMIASPESVSAAWGFSDMEKLSVSRQWSHAVISCLHLGDYATRHDVYSVQAILSMHTSAHLVGSTKEWSVYQAAATVIARGLGLHRLGSHAEDNLSPSNMTLEQKDAFVQREIGRRVWCALTSQDWLCSTSQGIYTLQMRHFTSILPRHLDEETMLPIEDETPTFTLVSGFLYEIGYMLARYLDDMLDAPDLSAKYNVVLRYDAVVRAMTIDRMPRFLAQSTLPDPAWPRWATWARRSYQASMAHKVIMIHQSFFGKSFKDSRYTYSRWACTSSSKTVIDVMEKRFEDQPQWWVEQAFVVTAGLCLGLDLFHRVEKGPEAAEHYSWVQKAIRILEQWPTSSVAVHGIRLLTSLLQEHTKRLDDSKVDPRNPAFPANIAPQALAAASETPPPPATTVPEDTSAAEFWPTSIDFDVDMLEFEDLLESLPMETGLDSNVFFDSMLSFGNNQFGTSYV